MELKLPFLTLVCQRIILILERLWTEPTGQRKKHWMMVRNRKYLTTVSTCIVNKRLLITVTVQFNCALLTLYACKIITEVINSGAEMLQL